VRALRPDLDRAQAAADTLKHDATLATCEPAEIAASLDEDDILGLWPQEQIATRSTWAYTDRRR
jgi:hypothetical protein